MGNIATIARIDIAENARVLANNLFLLFSSFDMTRCGYDASTGSPSIPLSLSLSVSLARSLGFIAGGINSAGSLCIPRRNIRAITYRI